MNDEFELEDLFSENGELNPDEDKQESNIQQKLRLFSICSQVCTVINFTLVLAILIFNVWLIINLYWQ